MTTSAMTAADKMIKDFTNTSILAWKSSAAFSRVRRDRQVPYWTTRARRRTLRDIPEP